MKKLFGRIPFEQHFFGRRFPNMYCRHIYLASLLWFHLIELCFLLLLVLLLLLDPVIVFFNFASKEMKQLKFASKEMNLYIDAYM